MGDTQRTVSESEELSRPFVQRIVASYCNLLVRYAEANEAAEIHRFLLLTMGDGKQSSSRQLSVIGFGYFITKPRLSFVFR